MDKLNNKLVYKLIEIICIITAFKKTIQIKLLN